MEEEEIKNNDNNNTEGSSMGENAKKEEEEYKVGDKHHKIDKKTKPDKTGIKRDKGGRIMPGSVSLNPKGRPEGTLSLVNLLKKKLATIAPNSQKTWAELFIDKMFFVAINDRGDASLMKDIINRIDGMPKQNIGFDVNDTIEKIEIEIVKSNQNNDIQTENNIGMGEKLRSISGQDNQNNLEPGGDGVK